MEAENHKDVQTMTETVVQLCREGRFEEAERIADQLFLSNNLTQATISYQKIIESNHKEQYSTLGLGNELEQTGYYQWNVAEWYLNEKVGKRLSSSPYDGLSLCYSVSKKYEEGRQWYNDQLDLHSNSFQLLIGLANIQVNSSFFEEALNSLAKCIEIRPTHPKAYVTTGLIYEFKRIQKTKSAKWAKAALQISPRDEYALFILARNEAPIDKKIQKLKTLFAQFPKNTRIANDIGIAYGGGLKKYDEAIEWYKKCVEVTPRYSSSYNNIGVNYELKKQYPQAKEWYFKAIKSNKDYTAPHSNLIDIYEILKQSDDQILQQCRQNNTPIEWFCYELGLAHYDKKASEKAISWYKRALQILPNQAKIYNSLAIAYDQIKKYDLSIETYKKCIELDPTYFSALYNLAITFKTTNRINEAIEYYNKCVILNPRHSYSYNNLGNIYKNREDYAHAIGCYENAVKYNSTYTLAFANLGVCYLHMSNFKEAFRCLARAEEILPNDNNHLSASNKQFLKTNLTKFKQEGEKWRKYGSIGQANKQQLENLVNIFEGRFKTKQTEPIASAISEDKLFKPEILQIIKIAGQSEMKLSKLGQIFKIVEKLCNQDSQYFHIIPQLLVIYFWRSKFDKKTPLCEIQCNLNDVLFDYSASFPRKDNNSEMDEAFAYAIQRYTEERNRENLFNQTAYFSYESLYGQLQKINQEICQFFEPFRRLVDEVRIKTGGSILWVSSRIPEQKSEQFGAFLDIFSQILSVDLTDMLRNQIVGDIEEQLVRLQQISETSIVHAIDKVWIKHITGILANRSDKNIETQCCLDDLLKARVVYDNITDLVRAIDVVEQFCKQKGYEIIGTGRRIEKKNDQYLQLRLRLGKTTVCELQLDLRKNEGSHIFFDGINKIFESPLGHIFGSYIALSRNTKISFLTQCREIAARWTNHSNESNRKLAASAAWLADSLQLKSS